MLDPIAHLRPALDPIAQQWGLPAFQADLLENLEFCDQMLLVLSDYTMSDDMRRDLYGSYIGPGPGGLLAFHWLVQRDQLDRALVRDYLACLQPGPARAQSLSEAQFLPLLQWLLEHWRGENEDLVLSGLCQLLNTQSIQARARCAGLRQALSSQGILPEWRTRLAHWACRSNHNDPDLPLANAELHRSGFLECVRLGEPPSQVVQEALQQLSGELASSAGQALLEMLEDYPREIPAPLQQHMLHQMKEMTISGLRRRAFQLLEQSEGEDWIHQGLRDRDAAVRGWAMQRARQRREMTA